MGARHPGHAIPARVHADLAEPARGRRRRPVADLAELRPRDRKGWRAWLADHHDREPGVWLVFAKRSGPGGVSLVDAVEEALCFGWIDSRLQRLDGDTSRLLFTPRRPGGTWAVANKRRVSSLIRRGLMTDAGLAVVRAAKRDGSWASLDAVESLRVPDDLAQALKADRAAALGFASAPPSRKKLWLWAVASARRRETRARRIAVVIGEMVRWKRPAGVGVRLR